MSKKNKNTDVDEEAGESPVQFMMKLVLGITAALGAIGLVGQKFDN